jgi:uncharacterized protein
LTAGRDALFALLVERNMHVLGLIALGAAAGALSGFTGVGGGVIIVPALVYLFGFSAHSAQGTTLALLVPPIGLVAAWTYFKKGYVDVTAAIVIAVAFIIGSALGARWAVSLPATTLRRVFAVVLGAIAFEMFFHGPGK